MYFKNVRMFERFKGFFLIVNFSKNLTEQNERIDFQWAFESVLSTQVDSNRVESSHIDSKPKESYKQVEE